MFKVGDRVRLKNTNETAVIISISMPNFNLDQKLRSFRLQFDRNPWREIITYYEDSVVQIYDGNDILKGILWR